MAVKRSAPQVIATTMKSAPQMMVPTIAQSMITMLIDIG